MAWHEKAPSGYYVVTFRLGGEKYRRSLKTKKEKEANAAVARVEENISLVQRGLMEIPGTADVISFLLSRTVVSTGKLFRYGLR